MANKKTTKRTAAIFAVIGALSLTGGVLAQSREDAHAGGGNFCIPRISKI